MSYLRTHLPALCISVSIKLPVHLAFGRYERQKGACVRIAPGRQCNQVIIEQLIFHQRDLDRSYESVRSCSTPRSTATTRYSPSNAFFDCNHPPQNRSKRDRHNILMDTYPGHIAHPKPRCLQFIPHLETLDTECAYSSLCSQCEYNAHCA